MTGVIFRRQKKEAPVKKALFLSLLLLAISPMAFPSCSTLDITDESLGGMFVGVPYSFQMHACCGTAPYTWSITSGSLPPGLSMNSSGQITGTPTTAGYGFFVCIKVTDAAGCTLTRCYDLEVD
jgi:hypothetical protein